MANHTKRLLFLVPLVAVLGVVGAIGAGWVMSSGPASQANPAVRLEPVATAGGTEGTDSRQGPSRPSDDTEYRREHYGDASGANPYSRRFLIARDCVKFRRLSKFLASQRDDPGSIVNDQVAFGLLSSEARAAFGSNQQFVAARAVECEAWWSRTADEVSASFATYAAALDAAVRGDRAAADCYVLAAWEKPVASVAGYEELVRSYTQAAPALVKKGVADGDWAMVSAATVAMRAGHGFFTPLPVPPADAYVYLRLAQMGAPDADFQSRFGSRAAEIATALTPQQLAQAERIASSTYSSIFRSSKMSDKELNQPCDM